MSNTPPGIFTACRFQHKLVPAQWAASDSVRWDAFNRGRRSVLSWLVGYERPGDGRGARDNDRRRVAGALGERVVACGGMP